MKADADTIFALAASLGPDVAFTLPQPPGPPRFDGDGPPRPGHPGPPKPTPFPPPPTS
jgi:hypothetical protein